MFNERLIPWFGTGTADALFLKKQANVCWASGFMGKDSCVLMTPGGLSVHRPALHGAGGHRSTGFYAGQLAGCGRKHDEGPGPCDKGTEDRERGI